MITGNPANGASDFLELVLAPVAPNKLGTSGGRDGSLGMGEEAKTDSSGNKTVIPGIPNAVQWGSDFCQNEGDATNLVNPTDGTGGSILESDGSNGTQVAGLRTTDANGKLNTVSGSTEFQSFDHGTGSSLTGFSGPGPDSKTDDGWAGSSDPNLEAEMTPRIRIRMAWEH